jgi:prepilin signal peptidase PulO-like enzyme (type II secretory pathway)
MTKEQVNRRWNAVALLAVALVAAVPPTYLPTPPTSLAGFIFYGLLAVTIVGFWLRMLIECVTHERGNHRPFWIALFFVIPIFSAFIYFANTRSSMWENCEGN